MNWVRDAALARYLQRLREVVTAVIFRHLQDLQNAFAARGLQTLPASSISPYVQGLQKAVSAAIHQHLQDLPTVAIAKHLRDLQRAVIARYFQGLEEDMAGPLQGLIAAVTARYAQHLCPSRTPPTGMASIALTSIWTHANGRLVNMMEVLFQHASVLDLINELMGVSTDNPTPPPSDRIISPKDFSNYIDVEFINALNMIGVQYSPDMLTYKVEQPEVYRPRKGLRVVTVQGTKDMNTPEANTAQLFEFLKWNGTEVQYVLVKGAPHAFDVPNVEEEYGKCELDWDDIHTYAMEPIKRRES